MCLLVDRITGKDNRRVMFQAALRVAWKCVLNRIDVQMLSTVESRAEFMQQHVVDCS